MASPELKQPSSAEYEYLADTVGDIRRAILVASSTGNAVVLQDFSEMYVEKVEQLNELRRQIEGTDGRN